ncbi:MAG: hypothetical protein NTV23_12565 [Propionibacteriales bacterium]|nr:hypothetical protein [Propionibacteriales bacterium]
MQNTYAAASLTALLLLGGTACGGADEVLGNAANAAGCAAARQAVAPVKDSVRSAVEDLGVDTSGAQRELKALKATIDTAAGTVTGEVQQSLKKISGDLGTLIDQARASARGGVDQAAVDRAQADLGSAVDDVANVC